MYFFDKIGYEGGYRDIYIFVFVKLIISILIGNVVFLMSFREKLCDNNFMYFISVYLCVYMYMFIYLFMLRYENLIKKIIIYINEF